MAVNKNQELKQLRTFSGRLADRITVIAGSMTFLVLNIIWFIVWILLNSGAFGNKFEFDKYPYGLLTMIVSLEAIILSSFVLISQNRQSKLSELRAELDYRTDVQAEIDVKTIVDILERLAKRQGVDVTDLLGEMKLERKKALRGNQLDSE